MPDPLKKIRREAARQRVEQGDLTGRSIQAALDRTTRPPKGVTIGYSAFLVSVQREINRIIRRELAVMNATLRAARADALSDDILASIQSLLETVGRLSSATSGQLVIGVANWADKTFAFNDAKYDTQLMRMVGIGDVTADVATTMKRGWVQENVRLVANMNREQVAKLEGLFLRALRDGSRSSQVSGEVSKILGGSEKRARLIARDQIGKLNGQLDRQKQTDAGIDSYVWRGALDARERPLHVRREGQSFKWSQPPSDGHPGQPVQCRCSSEPDLSELLGKEFAPDPVEEADFSQTTEAKQREARRIQANRRARRRAA